VVSLLSPALAIQPPSSAKPASQPAFALNAPPAKEEPKAPSPAQPNVMVEAVKEMAAGLAAIGTFAAVTGGTFGWGAPAGIGAAAGVYAATKEALNTGQAVAERARGKNTATDSVLMMAGDALNTNKALGLGDKGVTGRRVGDRALTLVGDATKGAASAGAMQVMRLATASGVAHFTPHSAATLRAAPQLLGEAMQGLSIGKKLGVGVFSAAAGQVVGGGRALAESSFHVATSNLSAPEKAKALQQAVYREAAGFGAGSILFGFNTFIPPGMKNAIGYNVLLGTFSNTATTASINAASGQKALTWQDAGIIAMSSVVDGAQYGLTRVGAGKAPLTDEQIYKELNEHPAYDGRGGDEPPVPALVGGGKNPDSDGTGEMGGQEPPPVDISTPQETLLQNDGGETGTGGQNSDGGQGTGNNTNNNIDPGEGITPSMSNNYNPENNPGFSNLGELIGTGPSRAPERSPNVILSDGDHASIRTLAQEHHLALRTGEIIHRAFGTDTEHPLEILKEQIETQVKPTIALYGEALQQYKQEEGGYFRNSKDRSSYQGKALDMAMSDFIESKDRARVNSLFKDDQNAIDLATSSELMRRFKGLNIDPTEIMAGHGLITPPPVANSQLAPELLTTLKFMYTKNLQDNLAQGKSTLAAEADSLDAIRNSLRNFIPQLNNSRRSYSLPPINEAQAATELMDFLNVSTELPTSFVSKSETVGKGGYVRNRVLGLEGDNQIPMNTNNPHRTPDNTAIFALPDFHGHADLFKVMVDDLKTHRQRLLAENPEMKFHWVQTGDMVDKARRPNEGSAHAVEALLRLREEFADDTFNLLPGNHEGTWVIPFLNGKASPNLVRDWITVRGGTDMLQSYEKFAEQNGLIFNLSGFDLATPPRNNPGWYDRLRNYVVARMPPEHLEYFRGLENNTSVTIGGYNFVHAGFDPTAKKPFGPGQQSRNTWDRDLITNALQDTAKPVGDDGTLTVVGHTILREPTLISNRKSPDVLGYDTGAATNTGISSAIFYGKKITIPTISLEGGKNYADIPKPHYIHLGDGPVQVTDSTGNIVADQTMGGVENFFRARLTDPLWSMTDIQQRRLGEREPNERFVTMAGDDIVMQRPDLSGQFKLIAIDRKGQTTPLNLFKDTNWTADEVTPELIQSARPALQHPLKDVYQTPEWFVPWSD
jgi:hypothetical protein